MKKICIIFIVSVLILTGCGNKENKEEFVNVENYSTDIYKLTIEEFKNNTSRDLKDLIILVNNYKDKVEEAKKIANKMIDTVHEIYGDNYDIILENSNCDDLDCYYTKAFLGELLSLATKEYTKDLITDEEINKYYEEKIFGTITAKLIFISSYENKKALEEAKEVINKLNNGESWKKLVEEYSDDKTTISKEGLIEFEHGNLTEEYEEAAKKLDIGEYTKTPVKIDGGYAIIYKVSQQEKPILDNVKEDVINILVNEKISSDNSLRLKTLEKSKKLTYDYLSNNQINEVLIDYEYYKIYDLNGKSIFSECKNEECTIKKYEKLDLNNTNIVELNKILHKVEVESLNYWLINETIGYKGEYETEDATGKISLLLDNDGTCYYINQFHDKMGLTTIQGDCEYAFSEALLKINGDLNYLFEPNSNYKDFLPSHNSKYNYEFDFNIHFLGKYIKNDLGIYKNITYSKYSEKGKYVLMSAADNSKVYSLNGEELFGYCDESEETCPRTINLNDYIIK